MWQERGDDVTEEKEDYNMGERAEDSLVARSPSNVHFAKKSLLSLSLHGSASPVQDPATNPQHVFQQSLSASPAPSLSLFPTFSISPLPSILHLVILPDCLHILTANSLHVVQLWSIVNASHVRDVGIARTKERFDEIAQAHISESKRIVSSWCKVHAPLGVLSVELDPSRFLQARVCAEDALLPASELERCSISEDGEVNVGYCMVYTIFQKCVQKLVERKIAMEKEMEEMRRQREEAAQVEQRGGEGSPPMVECLNLEDIEEEEEEEEEEEGEREGGEREGGEREGGEREGGEREGGEGEKGSDGFEGHKEDLHKGNSDETSTDGEDKLRSKMIEHKNSNKERGLDNHGKRSERLGKERQLENAGNEKRDDEGGSLGRLHSTTPESNAVGSILLKKNDLNGSQGRQEGSGKGEGGESKPQVDGGNGPAKEKKNEPGTSSSFCTSTTTTSTTTSSSPATTNSSSSSSSATTNSSSSSSSSSTSPSPSSSSSSTSPSPSSSSSSSTTTSTPSSSSSSSSTPSLDSQCPTYVLHPLSIIAIHTQDSNATLARTVASLVTWDKQIMKSLPTWLIDAVSSGKPQIAALPRLSFTVLPHPCMLPPTPSASPTLSSSSPPSSSPSSSSSSSPSPLLLANKMTPPSYPKATLTSPVEIAESMMILSCLKVLPHQNFSSSPLLKVRRLCKYIKEAITPKRRHPTAVEFEEEERLLSQMELVILSEGRPLPPTVDMCVVRSMFWKGGKQMTLYYAEKKIFDRYCEERAGGR